MKSISRICRTLGVLSVSLLAIGCPAWAASQPQTEPSIRAQLTARQSAAVSSEISAKIRSLPVQEGGHFAQGDILAAFDDSTQQAQVERAQAVLLATQRTFAANQRLIALKSIGQIELDLSEAEVAKAKAELAYAAAMLAKCQIKAPFSGHLAEQKVHEQEFVQPGQPMFEIIDDATPQIDFIVPSKWLSWLHTGQPLKISIDETGRTYTATVERISAKADPVSQSIKIVAGVTESAPELIAGMSGTVAIAPTEKP